MTIILVVQGGVYYGSARSEEIPDHRPLAGIPKDISIWRMYQEGIIEQEIQAVLKADDTLNRTYMRNDGMVANLFIAYFKSQRAGVAPHSPKNCLPGAGWVPMESKTVSLNVPGRETPIEINQYIVAKGENKSVVFYWYESHNRVIASEYLAKIYLVLDAFRYNRTDTSMVRVTVPVNQDNTEQARAAALDFIQKSFAVIRPFSPV